MTTLRKYVDQRFEDLKSERSSWIAHWRDLSNNIEPRIGRFLTGDNNRGSKKNGAIINSKATFALRILTAGLMTGLTSPARPWFSLGFGDSKLDDVRANRIWLDEVVKILLDVFRRSNVYQSLESIYEELGLGGTGAMFIEQSSTTVINTKTFTLGEYMLSIGADGRVDTMYREFRKTVQQLVDEYGIENVSLSTKNLHDNNRIDEWVEVRQAIEPNRKRRMGSFLSQDKPTASLHWEISAPENGPNEGFLRKSGFDEFPIMGPRWGVKTSDVYGRSPAMDILGDVKQLQSMERKKAKAIAKMIDPPMVGDANIHPSQVNTLPGGFTAVNNVGGQKSFTPAYQINPQLSFLLDDMARVEARIDEGMYVKLFQAISSLDDVRSATEIVERREEKLLALGPVIERLQVELLDPLIDRTFNIANRLGLIPEAPQDIENRDLAIVYISPLAQAQQAVATGAIERLGAYIGSVAQINPSALDKFDVDESIDQYARALGASPKLIISKDDVEETRAARNEGERQARAVASSAGLVDSLKTVSEIDAGGSEIVEQVLGGLTS